MKEENKATVRVVNIKQACAYIKNGVKPLNVYYTNRIVFVFDKESTSELFDKWRKYELV